MTGCFGGPLFLVIGLSACASRLVHETPAPLSILQSVTSNQQTRFIIVRPGATDVHYRIWHRGVAGAELDKKSAARPGSDFAVDEVEAKGLEVTQTYELRATVAEGKEIDRREFQSLDLSLKRARLAVISCMDDHLKDIADKMWPQLAEQRPDAIFLIGDNVYADHVGDGWQDTDPATLWSRYIQTRRGLPLFYQRRLIPTFAVWDDHDFGRNDANREYKFKNESREIFFTFFAQSREAPGFTRGPGVASWIKMFGQEFGLLDARFFRSPDRTGGPDETHFGPEQESWIDLHLQSAAAPVFLISGDQFFGGYHPFESYQGSHPRSFGRQLARWKKAPPPIVFVSGDRHLTEIINIPREIMGYATFEVTSSAIHAKVFADAFEQNPSPHQLVGFAGLYNYSILRFDESDRSQTRFNVRAYGVDRQTLYQKELTVNR